MSDRIWDTETDALAGAMADIAQLRDAIVFISATQTVATFKALALADQEAPEVAAAIRSALAG